MNFKNERNLNFLIEIGETGVNKIILSKQLKFLLHIHTQIEIINKYQTVWGL